MRQTDGTHAVAARACRAALLVGALCAATACTETYSLSPAVGEADALEAPELVGSWGVPDTSSLDIARVPGRVPAYRVVMVVREESDDSTGKWGPAVRHWYLARVGRLGGRRVAELLPDDSADAALADVRGRYWSMVGRRYAIVPFEVDAGELRYDILHGKAVHHALETGTCRTPYHYDSKRDVLTLTGDTAQVRAGMACLLVQPDVFDLSDSAAPSRFRRRTHA